MYMFKYSQIRATVPGSLRIYDLFEIQVKFLSFDVVLYLSMTKDICAFFE